MPPPKMTKAAQRRYTELRDLTLANFLDFEHPPLARTFLPEDWRGISTEPVPHKTRLTIRIDQDVAKFFRKLGPGYQATLNRVLRAFMIAKLTEVLGEAAPLQEIAKADAIDEVAMEMEVQLVDLLNRARRGRLGL